VRRYLARRLLLVIPTVLGVTIIIFIAMRLLPGDPLVAIFGLEGARRMTPEQRANLEQALGLRDPFVVQYGKWLRDIGTGEFGKSLLRGDSVTQFVLRRGPITLEIAVLAMLFSWMVGFPVGIISALRPNSWIDYASRMFSILFVAIPGFWLGLVMVLALILWFDYKAPILPVYPWENPWKNLQMIAGPGLVLGLGFAGFVARMVRSSLLEVIQEDYVRTARAKGLHEQLVIVRHALLNAILPVITWSSLFLGVALGGSVAVEKAFGVPGLGLTMIDAILDRDLPVVQNLVLLYAVVFVVVNLITDMSYAWLDPRIRYGEDRPAKHRV
jgi:peptide/nickel transport system permease protein